MTEIEKVWTQDSEELDDVLELGDCFVDNILRKVDNFSKPPAPVTHVNLFASHHSRQLSNHALTTVAAENIRHRRGVGGASDIGSSAQVDGLL